MRLVDGDGAAADEDLAWLSRVGEWVVGVPGVRGRDREVDAIIERVGRELAPVSPLVQGRSGSGRTSTIVALSHRLDSAAFSGPLATMPVFRTVAHRLVELGAAEALRRVADALGGSAILCIDDLEVAASLTRRDADDVFLRTLRSIVEEQAPRTVLVIDEQFLPALAAHAPELCDEVDVVPHPVLPAGILQDVAEKIGRQIEVAHKVAVTADVLAAALRPGPADGPAHPGLTVQRLDQAAVRARVDGRAGVVEGDVGTGEVEGGPVNARDLAERIRARVFGQEVAVRSLAERIALTRAGFDLRPGRPDGVFLLVGPTGTGKTELAHAVAEALTGADSIVRLDMGEYSQEWSQSALIGPPPGYSGWSDPAAWLTTRLIQHPSAVVLLDEFEKAHASIWNTFLHVFDEGRLTDSLGRTADCSKCVFLLTSNLGATQYSAEGMGFAVPQSTDRADVEPTIEQRVRSEVRNAFPPELFNRFDDVLVLRPLDIDTVRRIARAHVDRFVMHHRSRGYDLDVDADVVDHLAVTGFDPSLGARHLYRNIESLLIAPLLDVDGRRLSARLLNENGVPTIAWQPDRG